MYTCWWWRWWCFFKAHFSLQLKVKANKVLFFMVRVFLTPPHHIIYINPYSQMDIFTFQSVRWSFRISYILLRHFFAAARARCRLIIMFHMCVKCKRIVKLCWVPAMKNHHNFNSAQGIFCWAWQTLRTFWSAFINSANLCGMSEEVWSVCTEWKKRSGENWNLMTKRKFTLIPTSSS